MENTDIGGHLTSHIVTEKNILEKTASVRKAEDSIPTGQL
jgi:hypothetical protein